VKRAHLLLLSVCLFLGATPALAVGVATPSDTSAARPPKKDSRFYFGGSIGLSVSKNVVWVSVQPYLGYKLTKKASVGGRLTYQYFEDRRTFPTFTSRNYGGSAFGRYRVFSQGFAQVEYELVSIDNGDGRDLVPFLLVGGGYIKPLGPNTSLVVEILTDLLKDSRGSRYRNQEPRINVGIGVGF
jgi:hypothetical protein